MTSTAAYYSQAISILLEIQSDSLAMRDMIATIIASNPSVIVKAKNQELRFNYKLLKSKLDVMVHNWSDVRKSKIALIKKYRELTDCGLRESKEAVERIYNI